MQGYCYGLQEPVAPSPLVHGVGAWSTLGLSVQPSPHCGMALLVWVGVLLGGAWDLLEQGVAKRARPMPAFGVAPSCSGTESAPRLSPGLFTQPSLRCGMSLIVALLAWDVLSEFGWHTPAPAAATHARILLWFASYGGFVLLAHGVGAWAIPGLFMEPSMHGGMALLG